MAINEKLNIDPNIRVPEEKERRPGPTGRVTDPWKRVTDKVAIVAFSRTTRHMAPFDDPEWEIWGLNEEYRFEWMKNWDRWFQIHPEDDFRRKGNPNDPYHEAWLKRQKPLGEPKAFPIYMQAHFEDIAPSYEFPIDKIEEDLGINYYCSSISYMLGMAAWMGYSTVGLFGVEMASDTEYRYQRPNGEFWLGYMIGKGVKIILPEEANLLRGQRYGFDWLPNIGRQQIEFDMVRIKKQEEQSLQELNQALGIKNFLEQLHKHREKSEPDGVKESRDWLNVALKKAEEAYGTLNAVSGAKQYIGGLLARMDHQVAPTFGAEVLLRDTKRSPTLYDKDGKKVEEPGGGGIVEGDTQLAPVEVRDYYQGEEATNYEQPQEEESAGTPERESTASPSVED